MKRSILPAALSVVILTGYPVLTLSATLEEVVVIARKVEESLQDVPITVTTRSHTVKPD